MKNEYWAVVAILFLLASLGFAAEKSDLVMFGGDASRNFVSTETGLPTTWDLKKGQNIKWVADLGSQAYAGPLYYDGMIFVGTNNEGLKNPELTDDRGNVMAFDAKTGEFLWQSAHPKLPAGRVNDWPLQGICSTPAAENGVIYYVSNRAEIIAADADGFRDGKNDGPFTEEGEKVMVPQKNEDGTTKMVPKFVKKQGPTDEDILWKFDLIGELDVFPHNLAAGSPLIVGDLLFVITGQGVDEGHFNVPVPLAPSFVVVNKKTGELVWENADPGDKVLHGSWSNPSYGVFGGKPQVLFPGGDGWLRGFEPETGKLIWKFDLNPKGTKWELGGRGTRNNVISMAVVHDGIAYIGVGQDPEHGEGDGNLWAIDPAGKTGDITDSGLVWHAGGDDFHRTMSSASIHDGVMYMADLSGFVHAFDAKTGEKLWVYDTFAAIWGSTFYADGKVYIGDEDGDIAVLKAGREGQDGEGILLHETNMGTAVYTTPIAHDGVIYVASRTRLFAIEEGATWKAPEKKAAAKGN
jgi:outer membrane protein assembly factor BamB